MRTARLRDSFSVLIALAAVSGCGSVPIQPMPPLPDLRRLELSPADSERLVAAVKADRTDSLACFDPMRDDTVGVTPPVRIRGSTDAYPPPARKRGVQGWVALTYIIGTDGTVEPNSVFVLGASDTAFVDPARFVILNSLFAPGRRNGKPIRTLARQVAEFRLKKPKVGL